MKSIEITILVGLKQTVFLVGALEHDFYDFPWKIGNGIIIPADFHSIIFQRGRVGQPPSSIYWMIFIYQFHHKWAYDISPLIPVWIYNGFIWINVDWCRFFLWFSCISMVYEWTISMGSTWHHATASGSATPFRTMKPGDATWGWGWWNKAGLIYKKAMAGWDIYELYIYDITMVY